MTTQDLFRKRRKQLLKEMGRRSIGLLSAAQPAIRNRDVEYPYRPDSDFLYLTGFPEPDAVAVFVPGRKKGQYILFCRERDEEKERWEGRTIGPEDAVREFGADQAFPIGELEQRLPGLIAPTKRLYYRIGLDALIDRKVPSLIGRIRLQGRSGVTGPVEFHALDQLIQEQRLIKDPYEIETMRRAAQISARAHIHLMRSTRPGSNEYQLETEFQHACASEGAREQAYPPIVGGGENACVLHYRANSAPLRDGDLVLVDAGCELDYYASDITRTFPVNGHFSEAQRALYDLVLDAQLAAIEQVRPGNHWNQPHEAAVETLTRGLVQLGLLRGKVKKRIRKEHYKPYYMHRTGHWLGMDVHDVGAYRKKNDWRALEPGMVLTVEPGLYISANSKCDPKWWNIGIRIEDDVLVTEDGCEVLTRDVPKAADEIEALMANARRQ